MQFSNLPFISDAISHAARAGHMSKNVRVISLNTLIYAYFLIDVLVII